MCVNSINKCCDTCCRNKHCVGKDWFCKSCRRRQSDCSIYKSNKNKEMSK